jgi:inner membrane protein
VLAGTLASRWTSTWAMSVLAIAMAAVALLFDSIDRDTPYSVIQTGLLDEPSHFAATALCVLALRRFMTLRTSFVIAALIASVAIDLDHLPGYLGHGFSPHHGGRPYTHSVATVLVLLAIGAVSRRWRAAAAGVVFGLVTHFVRDICEGPPGVALCWPFSDHVYIADRSVFWAFIGAALALALLPRRRPPVTGTGDPRDESPVTVG